MKNNFDILKKELDKLELKGQLLYYAMVNKDGNLSEETKKVFEEKKFKLPIFKDEYDTWYTESLRIVKQIIPDRENDFIKQYKDEKRKSIDFVTYSIYDYLLGVRTTRGMDVIADSSSAIPKMQHQVSILKSAQKRFDSKLFDIKEVLQADIFDTELDASLELNKKGFVRGAGAIAGVVLEKHLKHVCEIHSLKSRKKHASISDFNQLLKENEKIDTSQWRFIQHLGDIRNLCDHPKDREPNKEDIIDLVKGVEKIIKSVY